MISMSSDMISDEQLRKKIHALVVRIRSIDRPRGYILCHIFFRPKGTERHSERRLMTSSFDTPPGPGHGPGQLKQEYSSYARNLTA